MPESPGLILRAAAVEAVLALGLDGLTDAGSVVARDRPERLAADPDRLCVVVLRAETPANEHRDNMYVRYEWPLLVVLFRRQASNVVRSDGWRDEARYAIRKRLWRQLFVENVEACAYDSDPLVSDQAVPANFDRSGQLFRYRYVEASTD